MKKLRESRGYSMLEMIMALVILVMLCATVFTMIFSGQYTYRRIEGNRVSAMNTRDALSYIGMRIRQNDYSSGVSVRECPVNGSPAIVIPYIENDNVLTWIYFDSGNLYEFTGYASNPPVIEQSTVIAQLDSFDLTISETNTVEINVTYTSEATGKQRSVSTMIALRSVQ